VQTPVPPATPGLDFQEDLLIVTVNQLLGRDWSLGARYQISVAELEDRLTALEQRPTPANLSEGDPEETTPRCISCDCSPASSSVRLFAEAQAIWNAQSNRGYSPIGPGMTSGKATVGRIPLPRRTAEVTLGLPTSPARTTA